MTDNMFDQWIASLAHDAYADKQQLALEQNTVINLSNPQVGDVFTFLPNEFWEVARVLPLHGELIVNKTILLLRNTTDNSLYSVPQRLTGNLERRTLNHVPQTFIRYLRSDIQLNTDNIAELAYLSEFADVDIQITWSEKHGGWSIDFEALEQPLSEDNRVARLQWAVRLMGGIYRGPFLFVRYDDDTARMQSMNMFVTFDVLDTSAEPDATLLDHLPPKIQPVEIDPTDINATAKTLLRHFDLDELVEVLGKLK